MTENNNHPENPLNQTFWDNRWRNSLTGWDVGAATPPITEYMKQVSNKASAILIPGCGNAYEAEFLIENGFTNITLLDISPFQIQQLKEKFKNNSQVKVICDNFFHHKGNYDIMIEQTFFCAQILEDRPKYVAKVADILAPRGYLIGVLFNADFGHKGPPFGGSKTDYKTLFNNKFKIIKLEECYNSIPPRAGHELFIHFKVKKAN